MPHNFLTHRPNQPKPTTDHIKPDQTRQPRRGRSLLRRRIMSDWNTDLRVLISSTYSAAVASELRPDPPTERGSFAWPVVCGFSVFSHRLLSHSSVSSSWSWNNARHIQDSPKDGSFIQRLLSPRDGFWQLDRGDTCLPSVCGNPRNSRDELYPRTQ